MMGAGRDLYTPALKLMGESLNITDRSVIQKAEALLQAQKPFVKTYIHLSITPESVLVTGEVWAALAYNGGAKALQEFEPTIRYVVTDEVPWKGEEFVQIQFPKVACGKPNAPARVDRRELRAVERAQGFREIAYRLGGGVLRFLRWVGT